MGQSESVEKVNLTPSPISPPCMSKGDEVSVTKHKTDDVKNAERDDNSTAVLPNRISLASNPAMFVTYNTSEFRQRYKSIKVLGKGSFAQVLLSIDRVTGEQRAVKVTEKNRNKSGNFVDRKELRKEVDLLKKLDHPNIMKLYEFYEDSKYCYIVTEVYSGGELFDEIIARKKFSEVDAAIIIKQILSGITYMNKHNVVHRDLKPENILLESKEKNASIKIIDFGLSTYLDLLKKEKDKLGTAYYIAPEILMSQECTEKCDVWSTGVILYILLSGCPPFGGSDEKKIIAKVQTGKYNFNLPQWKMVSESAMRLIDQMLTYKAENRISAAKALEHPWIKKMTMEYTKFDLYPLEASIKNIRQFHGSQSLANAALLYIGSKLTSNLECKQLTSVFTKIDTNGDGQLDRKELIYGYKDFLALKGEDVNELKEQEIEEEVDKILDSIDFDKSGFIEYSEFVTAAMDRDKLLTQDRLIRAFNMFDTDGSGKISTSELTALFNLKKDEMDSKIFQEIIKTVDQNNDGEIDFEEFQSMLKKICGVAEAKELDLNNDA